MQFYAVKNLKLLWIRDDSLNINNTGLPYKITSPHFPQVCMYFLFCIFDVSTCHLSVHFSPAENFTCEPYFDALDFFGLICWWQSKINIWTLGNHSQLLLWWWIYIHFFKSLWIHRKKDYVMKVLSTNPNTDMFCTLLMLTIFDLACSLSLRIILKNMVLWQGCLVLKVRKYHMIWYEVNPGIIL